MLVYIMQITQHKIMKLGNKIGLIRGIAEFARLEYAGLENDGQSRRGGICRTGK